MEQEQTQAQGMVCPHCHVDLVMSERQHVEIDYCPKCRGIWLDRGELDTIIDRAVANRGRLPASPVSLLPSTSGAQKSLAFARGPQPGELLRASSGASR